MTDEIKNLIEATVRKTIEECKRSGLLKQSDDVAYKDASEMLEGYYREGKTDDAVTYAIYGLRFDHYFRIFEMYFERHMTIEAIAAELSCDVSTVVRNKKRLILQVYREIL